MVRRLVEDEEVRARGDDERQRRAGGAHRPRARTPASRARPSPRRGSDRGAPVPAGAEARSPIARCAAPSSSRRARRRAGRSTRARRRDRAGAAPAAGARWPRTVSSSVVLPLPFGPTRPTCSPRSSANDTPARRCLSPASTERPVDLEDGAPAARRLEELEPEPLRAPGEERHLACRRASLLLEPPDLRQLGLRLLRLGLLRAEALDETLEPGDVDGDPVDRLLRVEGALGLLSPPDVPRPGEEGRATRFELEHGRRRRLEEPAVVCDEDDAGIERGELLLEPFEAVRVEVVGRLVQQEDVRVAGQRPYERRAGQLPARERRERPLEVAVGEAEPPERARHALAPAVPARVVEPRLCLGIPLERRAARGRRPPSPPRARAAPARPRGRPSRRGRSRAGSRPCGAAGAGRGAPAGHPSRRRAPRRGGRSRRSASAGASSCRRRSARRARSGRAARA